MYEQLPMFSCQSTLFKHINYYVILLMSISIYHNYVMIYNNVV